VLVASLSLLIGGIRRSQAGFPLIELSEFARPPLTAAKHAVWFITSLPRLLRR
jgi:hypothetical protein